MITAIATSPREFPLMVALALLLGLAPLTLTALHLFLRRSSGARG